MKKVAVLFTVLMLSTSAHAFIKLQFPGFFAGNSVGVKGSLEQDFNPGGSLYADVAFLFFTAGVEAGYNSFEKYKATAHYSYIEPYIGLQMPVDNWSVYARFGQPIILRNTNDFKYTDKTALALEAGWRSLWLEDRLLLGAGFKWHWLNEVEYQGEKFGKTVGMFFINVGYYWGWQ